MVPVDDKLTEDELIAMIEAQMNSGVSRLKVEMSEEMEEGEIRSRYHHGRCDVGSVWADGSVRNMCDVDDSSCQ